MGAVYKAHDPTLQRTVAIKVLAKQDEDASARLLQEARATSALNHPHICTIYEVGEATPSPPTLSQRERERPEAARPLSPSPQPSPPDGSREGVVSFIVMEHVEGKALSQFIPSDGLPPESVIRYGTQIADALSHAHERGIVHRDLKSQNIMITPEGRAKVLDFGLAARMPRADAEEVTKTQEALPFNQTGMLVGTLAYMAPEVLRGEAATARSDIWALGVLLYEMASGRLPFDGTAVTDVIAATLKDTPAPLATPIPPGLRAIAQRALAKGSSHRYATSGEVRAALEALESSGAARATPVADTSTPPSIAVLPFTNMSADPEQEYFCDGIAEEITSALVKVDRLRVAGRSSAFSFKGKRGDLREIGRTLDVGAILEGSVRRAGNRLRITAELVNVSDGYHLWSERYDRQLEDIFAVQDEIALAVVDALKLTLLGEEQAAVLKHSTENPEAYQLCLRARQARYRWTEEGLRTAMGLFEQALETDPNYALAHFGLGDCRTLCDALGREPPDLPKVRTHLVTALRLDPDLAEAHAVLGGIVEGLYEWNWPSAESRCRTALALDSQSARVHHVHGTLLAVTGHCEEAGEAARRAVELDPLNPLWNTGLLQVLVGKRDWDGALRQARATLDLAPDYWFAQCYAGQAWAASGQPDEAVAVFEQGVASSDGVAFTIGLLGNALARSGGSPRSSRSTSTRRTGRPSSSTAPSIT